MNKQRIITQDIKSRASTNRFSDQKQSRSVANRSMVSQQIIQTKGDLEENERLQGKFNPVQLQDVPNVAQLKSNQNSPKTSAIPASPNQTFQLFPYAVNNEKTKRGFNIEHNGKTISATQIKGDEKDPHSGYAVYQIKNKEFILHHIESDPEEGSGIGSLIMYYMAKIAQDMGYEHIYIDMAAVTAVGFYELLGFVSRNPAGADKMKQLYAKSDDDIAKALDLYTLSKAKIKYNTNPENRQLRDKGFWDSTQIRKEFKDLPVKEQQQLISQEWEVFKLSPIDEQEKIIDMMLHGRAVGSSGMIAPTATILSKVKPFISRWSPTWESAWESRKKQDTLTEFPRQPGE